MIFVQITNPWNLESKRIDSVSMLLDFGDSMLEERQNTALGCNKVFSDY